VTATTAARPGFAAVFAAMFATQVLVAVAGLAAPVLAPIAAPEFGVAAYLVGLFVSLMYAAAATVGLLSGALIARWGPVRVSQLCLALSATGLALAAIGGVGGLVAAALLLGTAYGPTTPASSHLLPRVTPPSRLNLVFSLKQTSVPLGNALAGAVLPGAALAFGWRVAVLGAGLACLVTALLLQPLRRGLDTDTRPVSILAALRRPFAPLLVVFATPPLRLLALTSFAYAGMQTSIGTFLVTYLVDQVALSPVSAGIVLSFAQAAGVGGRVLWGAAADRLGQPALLLGGIGLAMTVAALATGLFTPDWPYAAIVLTVVVFGGTAIAWNGVHLAQLARLAPTGRAAEVTGGTFFITFGGVTTVPLAFSLILGMTGSYTTAYAAVAALTLASGLAFLTRGLPRYT
jgi:MFS family permease